MTHRTTIQKNLHQALVIGLKYLSYSPALLLLLAIVFIPGSEAFSQPPPPGGTGGPPCWPPPCIPIDGGIGWLVAAGVAYGAKKSWDFSKKKEEDNTDV